MKLTTILILALFGIILGISIATLTNRVPKVYEEVIARSIIEDSDNLIKLLDENKYIEASYLSESINTQWWFLRNAYDTKFYDSISDKMQYPIWGMTFDLENLVNCTQEMGETYCLNKAEQIKSGIRLYQEQICPKSDLYNTKYIKKEFKDYPEQMEEYLEKVRC